MNEYIECNNITDSQNFCLVNCEKTAAVLGYFLCHKSVRFTIITIKTHNYTTNLNSYLTDIVNFQPRLKKHATYYED